MVHEENRFPHTMGQIGLCSVTAPQTDTLSPLSSGVYGLQQNFSNGVPSDIMELLSSLLANRIDINSEDLLLKLKRVVNENFELKETITQNNLALRQQMNLIVQWNQQVEQQQHQFRQEMNGVSKQLSSLQQENIVLKSTLSSFKDTDSSAPKFQDLDNTIQNLNQQLDSNERKLQTALEEKEVMSMQCTKLEGERTLLKCDLTAMHGEFQRLHLQRQELLSTVKDMTEKLKMKEKQLKHESPHKVSSDADVGLSSVDQLRQTLRDEKDVSTALLQELQDTRNQVEYLDAELNISRVEASKYKSKYQMSSQELHYSPPLYPADRQGADPELKRARDEVALLRDEVETLEAALAEERRRTSEERSTLNRLQAESLRMKKELSESRDRSEKNHYSDQYYQTKIKSIQEMHDEATAKMISYEELLGAKNDEIARLKKDVGQTKAQLAELESEGDTIAVLRAQVEVYQSDFRAEREAREAMAADRERLREDMRHLQVRNAQLMDELESYQRKHFNQGAARNSRSGSEEANGGSAPKDSKEQQPSSLTTESIWEKLSIGSDTKKADEPKKEEVNEVDENLLYCPKCNKSFVELRPLEEHVNRCLDED